MGGRRGAHSVSARRRDGKRPLGRSRLDGRIILKYILKKWDGKAWNELLCLQTETETGGESL
jgi:hypothetical protein